MKLISLNTWGGKAGKEGLAAFIKKHADVDVFCFQEVWQGGDDMTGIIAAGRPMTGINQEMLNDISVILPSHSVHFSPQFKNCFGLALFVKNSFPIQEKGEIFVYREKGYLSEKEWADQSRILQYATIKTPQGTRTICNVHGLWTGTKNDTDDRLLQSEKIANFLKTVTSPYVLTGDFNLVPETRSLKKLEDLPMRNLIKEFSITSTRSKYYDKPIRFADYTLTSPEIKVNDFKVLPDEVSDHLAMYLDFE